MTTRTLTTPAVPTAEPPAPPSRRTAAWVGWLFLTATVTFLVADTLVPSAMDGPDFLTGASAREGTLVAGALLAFATGLAVVGIALLLHPLLRRHSERLALGYVGFRVAELGAILLYVAVPLLVLDIGERVAAGTLDATAAESLGAFLRAQQGVAILLIWLFTSVAGTVLALGLHRSRLVPRPLVVLGLVGYPVLLAGTVLDVLGVIDVLQGPGMLAMLPGGLFELLLPLWLLARGFSTPAPVEESDPVLEGESR